MYTVMPNGTCTNRYAQCGQWPGRLKPSAHRRAVIATAHREIPETSLTISENLKFTNRAPQFFEMMIDVEVRDVRHLTDIIAALRATPAVNSADRARG